MADVLLFPQEPIDKLRLQLARCRNQKMLDQWVCSFRKARPSLPYDQVIKLCVMAGFKTVSLKEAGNA